MTIDRRGAEQSDVDRFDAHLNKCRICRGGLERALCHIGIELLFECAEDLDERWQSVARMCREQDRLEKEANANFEFYKGADESL